MFTRKINHNLQKQSPNRVIGLTTTLTFGKYAGFTVMEVIKKDKQYIGWLIKEVKQYTFSPKIAEKLIDS